MANSLDEGDVFLSITPELCGNDPHFHIVIFKTQDDNIIVVHTTKEIEKVKARCRKRERIKFEYIEPETCILINSTHCDSLSQEFDSIIDCNKAILKKISYFTEEKQYFKKCLSIKNLAIIPIIKDKIKKSENVEEYIKILL